MNKGAGRFLGKISLIGGLLLTSTPSYTGENSQDTITPGISTSNTLCADVSKKTEAILSPSGDIEVSIDNGKTWSAIIIFTLGTGLGTFLMRYAYVIKIRKNTNKGLKHNNRKNFEDFLNENATLPGPIDENDLLEFMGSNRNGTLYGEGSHESESVLDIQDDSSRDYNLELIFWRRMSISEYWIFIIFQKELQIEGNQDNITLYQALLELCYILGKKDEFGEYYQAMVNCIEKNKGDRKIISMYTRIGKFFEENKN